MQTTQPNKDHTLKEQIKHIYHTHKGRYGYRRIRVELNHRLAKVLPSTTEEYKD